MRAAKRYFRLSGILAVLITLYGGLLRLEAVTGRHGWMEQPRWAATFEARAARVARPLRPGGDWQPVKSGYVGDPINYLRFGREMRNFYQAHVREPLFPALTRAWLTLLDNSDIAVSFASATAGTLAVPATYLLGSLWGPAVGLAAATALAVEFEAIRWGADGWRDETFMLFVVLAVWAFIRLDRRPSLGRALLAGTIAAAACLTRLSALSFVIPALAWIVRPASGHRRAAWNAAVLAGLTTLLFIAPFLINSYRATGDPFLAVNFHTRYYRFHDGRLPDESQGALAFVAEGLQTRPLKTIDTAVTGLFVYPLKNKWTGFRPWWERLPVLLMGLAIAGQLVALFSRDGRLLLMLLYTSLIPYALTWGIGGGGAWRFTQHAYPLYLVAGFASVHTAHGWVAAYRSRKRGWTRMDTDDRSEQPAQGGFQGFRPRRIAIAVILVTALCATYAIMPFLVVREALAAGEPTTIQAGDGSFFTGAWSDPEPAGLIIVRAAMADRVAVRISLPRSRDYRLVIRMDPAETAEPAHQPRVTLFLNGQTIAQLRLTRESGRVGVYQTFVPRALVREVSRLDFVASHTVPASEAGPNFRWLPADAPVAFRLWYLRFEPA